MMPNSGFHHRVIVLDRAGDPMMSARKMNEEAAQESSQRSLPKSIHPELSQSGRTRRRGEQ
jgi:hypothetical protein